MALQEIQVLVDGVQSGGILKLSPANKEFEGPLIIRKPITIEGHNCTIWNEQGPILTVKAKNVSLKNLIVEITDQADKLKKSKACAIKVENGQGLAFENVAVRGNITGLKEEEGEWRYPRSLRLRDLQVGHTHCFFAKVVVPVPCTFRSDIAGVTVTPQKTKSGAVPLQIQIDPLAPGTRLRGRIAIHTASLTRYMTLTAHAPSKATGREAVGSGQDVYVPDDWQTFIPDGSKQKQTKSKSKQAKSKKSRDSAKTSSRKTNTKKTTVSPPPLPQQSKAKPPNKTSTTPGVDIPDKLDTSPPPSTKSPPNDSAFAPDDSPKEEGTKPPPDLADPQDRRYKGRRRKTETDATNAFTQSASEDNTTRASSETEPVIEGKSDSSDLSPQTGSTTGKTPADSGSSSAVNPQRTRSTRRKTNSNKSGSAFSDPVNTTKGKESVDSHNNDQTSQSDNDTASHDDNPKDEEAKKKPKSRGRKKKPGVGGAFD